MIDKKVYYITSQQGNQTLTAEEYEQQKDSIHKDNPFAVVQEVGQYNEGDEIDDNDKFYLSRPNYAETMELSAQQFRSAYDKIKANYPDAKIARGRTIRNLSSSMQDYNRLQSEIDEYDKAIAADTTSLEETAATQGVGQGEGLAYALDRWKARKAIDDKTKKRDALAAERDNNDYYRAIKDSISATNKSDAERVGSQLSQIEADNEGIQWTKMPLGMGGLGKMPVSPTQWEEASPVVADYHALTLARKAYDEAQEILDAPTKHDGSSNWRGYWQALAKGVPDALLGKDDFDTALQGVMIKAISKAQEGAEEGVELNFFELAQDPERMSQLGLTAAEQELIKAITNKTQIEAMYSSDISAGYQAGQSAAESLPFMRDFILTAGIGSAVGKAITKPLIKKTAEAGLKGIARTGAKLGINTLDATVTTVLRTPLMASSWTNFTDQMTQIDSEGKVDMSGEKILKVAGDVFIENLSEMSGRGLSAAGKAVGKAVKPLTKGIAKTKFGEAAKALYNPQVKSWVETAGFNGIYEELGEEWYGNALRTITRVDPNALKNFADFEQQLITLASFGLMTGVRAGTSLAMRGAANLDYEQKKKAFVDYFSKAGYDEETINNILDINAYETPEDLSKGVTPVLKQLAQDNRLDKDAIKVAADLVKATARLKGTQANLEVDLEERRNNAEQELLARLNPEGGEANTYLFSDNRREGDTTPTGRVRVIDKGNKRGYLTTRDEDGVYTIEYTDGTKGFISEAQLQEQNGKTLNDSGWLTRNEYLDQELAALKLDAEQRRIREEGQVAQNLLSRSTQVGQRVNLNTEEAPIYGTILSHTPSGYVVETEDGQAREVSKQEMANHLGISLQGETDAARELREGVEQLAREQSIRRVNDSKGIKVNGQDIVKVLNVRKDESGRWIADAVLADDSGSIVVAYDDVIKGYVESLPVLAEEQQRVDEANAEVEAKMLQEKDGIQRDFRGNPLPLLDNGSVDQTALWNADPEAWAKWNDSRNNDNGADSINYITAAANTLANEIAADIQAANAEMQFDVRDTLKAAVAQKQARLETLNGILNGYAQEAEARERANAEKRSVRGILESENNVAPMSVEEAEALDTDYNNRYAPAKTLGERANILGEYLGVISNGSIPAVVVTSQNYQQVMTERGCSEANIAKVKEQMDAGLIVDGFTTNGEIYLMVDGINSLEEARVTYVHERQHLVNSAYAGTENDRVAELASLGREELLASLAKVCDKAALKTYSSLSDKGIADELICRLIERVYTNEDYLVTLGNEGISENVLSIIKTIDNEQRENTNLSNARRGSRRTENESEALGSGVAEDERNLGEVSNRVLGEEAVGSAEDSERGVADGAETSEPIDRGAVELLNENGLSVDEERGDVRFSIRYPLGDKRDAVAEAIAIVTGRDRATIDSWLTSEESLTPYILDELRYLDYPIDDRYEAVKKNSDYPQGTVDFNNICRKRLPFTRMFTRLQRRYPNKVFNALELADIRNIMKDNGLVVACGLCYVEDRRQLVGEVAEQFISELQGNFVGYANNPTKIRTANKMRKLVGGDTYVPSIYNLTTQEGLDILNKEHQGIWEAFQVYNNARGQQAQNLPQGYAEYKREILGWSDAKVKSINNNGGLRIFSYSDFEAHHLLDIIQIIIDCAARGVMMQGYTKVPAFARVMANTNVKLNRSLIPLGDTGIVDGQLAFDPVEGIDVDDPNFLEPNDNVGNILIGINDEQIRLAMADPRIHYIIPYHARQKETVRAKLKVGKWTNYISTQNERNLSDGKRVKDNINIYTDILSEDITNERQFVEKYLQLCKEMGRYPKFDQFLNKDENGEYAYAEGYYKFLLDFKLFDESGNILPQKPVIPQFDDAFNQQILEQYVADESAATGDAMNAAYDQIVEALGLDESTAEGEDIRFRITPEQDAEYLAAVERGDIETAQRMVLEAAKLAMPNTKVVDEDGNPKVVYHGTGSKFYTFRNTSESNELGAGYYFSDSYELAERYSEDENLADNRDKIESLTYDIFTEEMGHSEDEYYDNDFIDEYNTAYARATQRLFENSHVKSVFLNIENPFVVGSRSDDLPYRSLWQQTSDAHRVNDGIIDPEFTLRHDTLSGNQYVAFSPSQIKSADPVTYDDNGNVIPLSERFNPENTDIRFAVRSDEQREKLFDDAKAEFGTTNNFDVAGYMLPDGSLLDFSSPEEPSIRDTDHRAIARVINDREYNSRTEYMDDFVNEGAIRMLPEMAGVYFAQAPTPEQRKRMLDFFYKHNGENILEIINENGNTEAYVEYNYGTSPSRIMRDIDGYFNEGITPQQPEVFFRLSNENQIIFVSNAARAVESIKMEKATPEQWLKMIEKGGGLKAGEDKWMGLSDWLKASDKKTLTKAEVLDFINENMIVIEETHYTADAEDDAASRHDLLEQRVNERYKEILNSLQDIEDYDERRFKAFDQLQEELGNFADNVDLERYGVYLTFSYVDLADYIEFADMFGVNIKLDNPIHDTRLAYTTSGLNNQHEIALTVPTIKRWNTSDELHFGDAGDGRAIAWIRFGDAQIIEEGSLMEYEPKNDIEREIKEYIELGMNKWGYPFEECVGYAYNQITDAPQESVGWTEDAVTAVAEGMRGKARSRKILVIDEIQSKRHQEGREKGYMTKEERANFDAHLDVLKETQDALLAHIEKLVEKYPNTDYHIEDVFKNIGAFSAEDKAELRRLKDAYDAEYAKGTAMVDRQSKLIPDAPFDKNWHELAMKRMLRYAAENDYDVVAWTKGDQQAERYNIGNYLSSIDVQDEYDGKKDFGLYVGDSDEALTITVNEEGTVTYAEGHLSQAEGRPLSDLVGKELAVKMMQAETDDVIEDVDIKIGGEGMKGFYDKMLPAFVNKYGKKWGVKVEDITLPNVEEAGRVMHSIPVTEEMKESVMEGQVMFRTTAITPEVREEMKAIKDAAIADGIFMKAPNGKDTNLTEEQWLLVRTKNFINWFGDWMKPQRIQKLRNSDPVMLIGNEYEGKYELNRDSAQKYILNELRDTYTIADTNERIKIVKKGAKKVTSHSMGNDAHMRSIAIIPEIIKSAIFITEMPAEKADAHYDSYRYYVCGLEYAGDSYTVKMTVGVKNGDYYYDHTLTDIEKGKLLDMIESQQGVSREGFTPTGNESDPSYALSDIKDRKLVSILQNNFSKVVDENGEPKVVMHNSPRLFTEFNKGKIGTSTDWGAFGKGFYFSNKEHTLYGSNRYDVFLNLANPYVIRGRDEAFAWKEAIATHSGVQYYEVGKKETDAYTEYLKEQGYDGVIYEDTFSNINEYVAFEPNQIKSAADNNGEFSKDNDNINFRTSSDSEYDPNVGILDTVRRINAQNELDVDGVRYRAVTDQETIDWLESGKKYLFYRNVVLFPNGTFGSPMASKLSNKGAASIKTSGFALNEWEMAEEHPELVKNGKIRIVKPNGKPLDVDYNPYVHSRPNRVNTQFKQAWERPDLIYIETEVSSSDIDEKYHAPEAARPIGLDQDWNGGKLTLSRYDKPVRMVPWAEVADDWMEHFGKKGIHFDIIPPSLLPILAERGAKIIAPHKNMGKECFDAYDTWKANPNEYYASLDIPENVRVLSEDNGVRFKIDSARHEGESDYDYTRRMVSALYKEYKSDASVGTVSWDGGDTGGYYDPEKKLIVIYTKKDAKFADIEDTYFHEQVHHALTKLPEEARSLGYRFLAKYDPEDLQERVDRLLKKYREDEIEEEVTAFFIAECCAYGSVGEMFSGLSGEDEYYLREILKTFNYDAIQEFDFREYKGVVGETSGLEEGTSSQDSRPTNDAGRDGLGVGEDDERSEYDDTSTNGGIDFRTRAFEDEVEGSVDLLDTHAIVRENGLAAVLGTADYNNFIDSLYADANREVRGRIVGYAADHGYNFRNAIARTLANLIAADEQPEFVQTAVDALQQRLGGMPINDAKWMLYLDGTKGGNALDEIRRAQMAHSLGFDTYSIQAKRDLAEDFRLRVSGDMQNRSAIEMYLSSFTPETAIIESHADMYVSVENLLKAIEESSGSKREVFEDVMLALNQLSSKNFSEKDKYQRDFLDPMWDTINAIISFGRKSLDDVVKYVMLKHGLERNEIMAKDEARSHYLSEYNAKVREIKADESTSEDEKNALIANAKAEYDAHIANVDAGADAIYAENRKADYSGLMAQFYEQVPVERRKDESRQSFLSRKRAARIPKFKTLAEAEAEARRLIDKFEFDSKVFDDEVNSFNEKAEKRKGFTLEEGKDHSLTDMLWERINAATKETLRHQLASGMISKKVYDSIANKYQFYVPLRGFKEEEASDLYHYMNQKGDGGFTAPILKAKGRRSLADNPFGMIGSMAESAIQADNKNLAKQKLYYFLSNRPDNGLAEVRDVWYEDTGLVENGKKVFRKRYPEIKEGMTQEEINKAIQDLEDEMKQKKASGVRVVKKKKNLDLQDSVVKIDSNEQAEHIIKVNVLGEEQIIIVNANPRAAQAINGKLNIEADRTFLVRALMAHTRLLSALATSLSGDFVPANLVRDLQFAQVSTFVEHETGFTIKMNAKILRLMMNGNIFRLVNKQGGGKGLNIDKTDPDLVAAYDEYVMNGGPTGYTYLTNNAEYDKKMKQYLKRQTSPKAIKAVLNFWERFKDTVEAVEQISRFAAYLTAKEEGMSIPEAVNASKEVTLNFNRKGSGKYIGWEEADQFVTSENPIIRTLQKMMITSCSVFAGAKLVTMFYNATVQGISKFIKLFKKSAPKMIAICIGMTMLGMFNAMMHLLWKNDGDDDEKEDEVDDYFNIPTYKRRSSLCLGTGKENRYISIPLPQELVPFYSLGDMIVTSMIPSTKIYPNSEPIKELAITFGELLPFNIVSVVTDEKGLTHGVVDMVGRSVSAFSTPYSLMENETFYGGSIHPENKYEDEAVAGELAHFNQKREKTAPIYQTIAEGINKATGGDDVKGGIINPYPDDIKFVLGDIIGGAGKFWVRVFDTARNTIKGEETLTEDVPILNRVMVDTMEKNRDSYYHDIDSWLRYEELPLLKEMDERLKENYLQNNPEILAEIEDLEAKKKALGSKRDKASVAARRKLTTQINTLSNPDPAAYAGKYLNDPRFKVWWELKDSLDSKFLTKEIAEIDKRLKAATNPEQQELLKAEKWRLQKRFVEDYRRLLNSYEKQ